jgi:uncharacterized membrane protein YhaH (DUF805 family)
MDGNSVATRNTNLYTLIINVIGVILFLMLPFIFYVPESGDLGSVWKSRSFWREAIFYLSLAVFYYVHYYVFIPKIYFKRLHFLYGLVVLLCAVVIFLLPDFILPSLPNKSSLVSLLPGSHLGQLSPRVLDKMQPWLFTFLAIFLISLLLSIDKRYKDVRKEKLDAELKFYKAQINPHFLFNTLNAIYALTLEKSDLAPEAVSKLSSIMRFATNEVNRDKVALIKEIEYINDYVELQKMRLGDTCHVDVSITGNYSNVYISPLILITFIENAFKYGVSTEHRTPIDIVIYIQDKILRFYVKNRIIKTKQMTSESQGLRNAKRQLQLVYPDKHNLEIATEKNKFVVLLTLDLG